jgi:FkbM family methyltransferase
MHEEEVFGELNAYACLPIPPGDKVLDIGGHVGLFTRYAINKGAIFVMGVEPSPQSCKLYKMNTDAYEGDVKLIKAALVPETFTEDHVKFYESSTCSTRNTLIDVRGRNQISVKCVKLKELFQLCKFDVVKIDIEGGEYCMLDEILETFKEHSVKAFAIEFHFMKGMSRDVIREYVKKVNKYFTPLKITNITDKCWTAIGIWER